MNKLKSSILYVCSTKIMPICIFYLLQFIIITFIIILIKLFVPPEGQSGMNSMEINSLVFVGIMGVMSFICDFKMLLQNGFTRKYIFIATIIQFMFMSSLIALVDVVLGQVLHCMNHNYNSIFGCLYGYNHLFMNWYWLALLYMLILSLFYMCVLIFNKAGKKNALYIGIIVGGVLLLIITLFVYVFSKETIQSIFLFIKQAMGFMANGTINVINPAITFLLCTVLLESISYIIIRRTELK